MVERAVQAMTNKGLGRAGEEPFCHAQYQSKKCNLLADHVAARVVGLLGGKSSGASPW